MKSTIEKRVFTLFVLIILAVLSGCSFFTGPAGEDGGNIVGGSLVFSSTDLTADSQVRIVFDPDGNVLSGNETIKIIHLADYIESGSANFEISWSAPEVGPGDYYVYYWLDFNGDGSFNGDILEENTIGLFGSGYSISSLKITGTYGTPFPNYTVTENFALQLYLYLSGMGV